LCGGHDFVDSRWAGGCLLFFGIVVLMRWLVIGLLVSVAALLLVAVGVARHVWRQRRLVSEDSANLELQEAQNLELDVALEIHETDELPESKDLSSKGF